MTSAARIARDYDRLTDEQRNLCVEWMEENEGHPLADAYQDVLDLVGAFSRLEERSEPEIALAVLRRNRTRQFNRVGDQLYGWRDRLAVLIFKAIPKDKT